MILLFGLYHDREPDVPRHFLSFGISNCNCSLGIGSDNFLVGHGFGFCVLLVHMHVERLSYRYHMLLRYQHYEFSNGFFKKFQVDVYKVALFRPRVSQPIKERVNDMKPNLN